MLTNRLSNPSFEGPLAPTSFQHRALVVTPDPASPQASYVTERGEINNPEGWRAWYVHDRRPPAHDPTNPVGWAEPEVRLAPHEGRQFDALHGVAMYTFSRIHHGGLMQTFDTTPGELLRAGGYAHAWSSNTDDAFHSEGVGRHAFSAIEGETQHNQATFRVGIDPTGGTDPTADTVVWGPGIHVYNAYAPVPELRVEALGASATLFTSQRFLWPFKHCDGYWDALYVYAVEEAPDPPEPPQPPETELDYEYPVIAAGSKLTSHAIGEGGTYDLLRYLVEQGSPPAILKVVAGQAPQDLPAIRNLKALSPTTRIIARVIQGEGGFNPQGWGPRLDAETYMAHFTRWARAYPEIEWFELWNEENPVGTAGHVQMAEFSIRCMGIAEREGYKLALKSYSTGVPENETWLAIWEQTEFFRRAQAGGHILSLHAYCRTADEAATRAHLLRPTWLYEQILIPANCVIPFVHTELSIDETRPGVGIKDWKVDDLMSEYGRMDDLLGELWYCLGATIYTFGQIEHYNHDKLWRQVGDLILSRRERVNALPPETQGDPDDGYDSTVLVVDYDRITDHAVRKALYDEAADRGIFVGPSHDEASQWPRRARSRTVELVGFSEDDQAHVDFYRAEDPRTQLVFRPQPQENPEPPQPPPTGDLWDRDITDELPRRYDLARWPGGRWPKRSLITHVTVHHIGSLANNLQSAAHNYLYKDSDGRPAYAYTYIVQRDGEILKCLHVDEANWHDNSPGQAQHLSVGLNGGLHNYPPTQAQLDAAVGLIAAIVRSDELEGVRLDVTRDRVLGHRDWFNTICPGWASVTSGNWKSSFYAALDAALGYAPPAPPAPQPVSLGFNDPNNEGAGKWMADEGLPGLLVVPLFIGGSGAALDFSAYEYAGLRVIVNLRFSWSTDLGGAGTLPRPGTPEHAQFVDAAAHTIAHSRGVWGYEIGNEANNPREFPRGHALTPQDVVSTYNAIYDRVAGTGVRLSPGSLDPFHATHGDPRVWLKAIYEGIRTASFVAAHGYTRGPDPDLVNDTTRFTDAPLEWQYRNYPRCVTALLEALPAAYRQLPVYITEINHLSRTGTDGNYGWVNDERAGAVVEAMVTAARQRGFAGLALYRWQGDEWAVRDNRFVLEAVKRLA